MVLKAYWFEDMRKKCKDYLKQHDLEFDKFTVVSHDSFVWYITEFFMKEYIEQKSDLISVGFRSDDFDHIKIHNIVQSNSSLEEDYMYIKRYFYDKRDLFLEYKWRKIYIDIKTALTEKEPNNRWNFLYPVVQANKPWKDYMVLSYYVADSIKDIKSLNKIVVVWYISEDIIKKCEIIKACEKTKFGTVSQIDNYITELSLHYKDLDKLIDNIINS